MSGYPDFCETHVGESIAMIRETVNALLACRCDLRALRGRLSGGRSGGWRSSLSLARRRGACLTPRTAP